MLGSLPHKSRRTSFRTLKFLPLFPSSILPHFGQRPTYLRKTHSDYLDRYKLAIVCSARSGSTKSLGTTNLLLRAASEALHRTPSVSSPVQSGIASPFITSYISRGSRTGSPPETPPETLPDQHADETSSLSSFNKTVDLIHSEHIAAARGCVTGKGVLSELEAEIDRDCESLRAFLYAAQVRPRLICVLLTR